MTGLSEARRARTQRARDRIWDEVLATKKLYNCSCPLRKGMTFEDLSKIRTCTEPRYICPVTDKYRRLVGYPLPSVEDA